MQHPRPAMRPVVEAALPPGRRSLSSRWCRPEMEPGTTVLARRLTQERRARLRGAGRMKRNPDETAQDANRSWLNYKWEGMVRGADIDEPWSFERLFTVSTAID